MDFIAYVTSLAGQSIIAKYAKHGTRLFNPDATPSLNGKK